MSENINMDEWVTVTYNKEIQLTKLPRTGNVNYSNLLIIALIMIVNCIGISIIVKNKCDKNIDKK